MILLIDTSRPRQALALADGNKIFAVKVWQHSPLKPRNLLLTIDRFLKRQNLKPLKINALIFNTGPGSFTSLRAAASVVNGWQLARGSKIAGVSLFEVAARTYAPQRERLRVALPTFGDFFEALVLRGRLIGQPKIAAQTEGFLPPERNLKGELQALLELGRPRLRSSKKVIAPLYVRSPSISRVKH